MSRFKATIVFGSLFTLVAGFILFIPKPAQAITACCCLEKVNGWPCSLREITTTCEQYSESGRTGILHTSDPYKCNPGAATLEEINEAAKKATELKFTPNVPIPGLFEGTITVDGTLISRYVKAVYVYFVWIVGILATVMVMYGGIQWVTAAGNSSRIENAKQTMNGAFIAIVLTLTSFLLLRLINPALVKITDLSILTVPTILIGEGLETSEKGSPAAPLPAKLADLSKVTNVVDWDSLIISISDELGVDDPYYVKAIMMIESRGNPDAVSPAGACGIMQVMKENSNGVCLKGMANAEANLRAGISLIKSLFANACPTKARYKSGDYAACDPAKTSCANNWHYVIAAYNGGRSANCSSITCQGQRQTWWECAKNPGYAETRNYVLSVERMYQIVRGWGGL